MNIAVLGTGKVGSTLGARLTLRGHRVLYGSRTPTGPDRLDHRSAVTSSDLVVTALPGNDVLSVLNEIGDEALGDKILLDPSATIIPQTATEHTGGEVAVRIQTRFPRTRVVKTLNTMNFAIMVDPLTSVPAATVFVSGDDIAAKTVIIGLLGDLGWPDAGIIDLGGIDTAAATEQAGSLYFAIVRALGDTRFNLAVSR
ncbi:NADPH-dependent F420 reductase [Streptomyces lonegramiae]|uniref:NAD(P)-binding domain-containing protein n=1 Tax=Streptomyces lonegramiae TaxID=3075524 RepID=A0ABU2XFG1_9ACTN|nr:NAD(P)-binding domain-containing protein [Streptomyces sp. DSM 41529]MDT0544673.1 NAD(P)-binding domain-containing protein [Streptomyces sp. DSM 41529]